MRTFHIDIDEALLVDLKQRLRQTRWPRAADDAQWQYGANLDYMRQLADYWLESYDWRAAERELNRFPQFMTRIGAHDIHFIHERGSGAHATPLILNHGWPGSFHELLGIADLLAHPERHGAPDAPSFDVIIPSLPGYGFSSQPARPIGPRTIASLWHQLMTEELGYSRYAAQGGDWGSFITAWLGADYPASVSAIHLNGRGVGPYRGANAAPPTAEEHAWINQARKELAREGAYQHVHATKPLTLAYGLTDSPVALAAWIVEKFHGWTTPDADTPSDFTMDQLLTNISIYWFTNTIQSSTWLYRAGREEKQETLGPGEWITVPTGLAVFPNDLLPPCPRTWLERVYNLTHYSVMPRGGHFAALGHGPLLVADIRAFFNSLNAK
ncbi:MAG: epoxide hydrolase family protein [Pseudomonadota bacterium]